MDMRDARWRIWVLGVQVSPHALLHARHSTFSMTNGGPLRQKKLRLVCLHAAGDIEVSSSGRKCVLGISGLSSTRAPSAVDGGTKGKGEDG